MLHTAKIIGDIHACAEAAAMSYNKDLSKLTKEEVTDYVKRIWDRHTNVSEYFVGLLKFTDIPRIASLLFAFQRDITITEMSQRRCMPSVVTAEYLQKLTDGEALQDARKCLPVETPSNMTVLMNRVAAKNVSRIFHKYEKIDLFRDMLVPLEIPRILSECFMFDVDDDDPFDCPEFNGVFGFDEIAYTRVGDMPGWKLFFIPMYSFHQFCRHRKTSMFSWNLSDKEIRNDTLVRVLARSFHWDHFAQVRSGADTQEPLRSMALQIKEEMKL